MNDFEIMERAAREIANDRRPYRDIRDAFETFANKLRRMKEEQARSSAELDDEIPF